MASRREAGKRTMMPAVRLRAVRDEDLPVLYEHQLDEAANRMAAFRPRDRDAFMAHWARILDDATALARAIEADGTIVGNIGSWAGQGVRLVGYWIGREHWGRGIATAALRAFLDEDRSRPLHALVATENLGSIRVLEKCGFQRSDEELTSGDEVEELVVRLDA
jgi:RimJ/RimL family protein N-acetyltransferase